MDVQRAKYIWDFLIKVIPNPFGVAGLMGNLMAESSFDPECLTGNSVKTKESKKKYISDLEDGTITSDVFSHDGVAFGIVQWRYWSRKESLYAYSKKNGVPICALDTQLHFMWDELQAYKTVHFTLVNATSIRQASDAVMERYEKPGSLTEQAREKRAMYGTDCYIEFAAKTNPENSGEKYVQTTARNVNMRAGNGLDYDILTQIHLADEKFKWVATAQNGWHAVVIPRTKQKSMIAWVSPDYSKIISS